MFSFQPTEPSTPVTASQVSTIDVLNLLIVISYYIAAANYLDTVKGIWSINCYKC